MEKGKLFHSIIRVVYFPLLVSFIVEKEVTIVGEGLAACCCGGGNFIAHCFDLLIIPVFFICQGGGKGLV